MEGIMAVEFTVDKYKVIELDNSQLTKVEIYVCHDKNNKNGSYISLENMVRAQNSMLRKPLLYKLNETGQDFLEHEDELLACGFVDPIYSGMRYEEIDGRTYFIISCIVWKVYMQNVLKIFNRDGIKKISMEANVSRSEWREDGFLELIDYKYLGIVLLGDDYETGMYNTSSKIANFSRNDLDKKIQETEGMLEYRLKESDKEDELMAEVGKIEAEVVVKVVEAVVEEVVAEFVEAEAEVVVAEVEAKVETEPEPEAKLEDEKAEFSKEEETSTKLETDKDTVIFTLDQKVKDLEVELELKNSEIETLAKFKAEKDLEVKEAHVTKLFSNLSKILSKDEINEWKTKESTYANVEEFDKDITKFAVDKVIENVNTDTKQTFSKMHVSSAVKEEKVEPKGMWEKVKEYVGEVEATTK